MSKCHIVGNHMSWLNAICLSMSPLCVGICRFIGDLWLCNFSVVLIISLSARLYDKILPKVYLSIYSPQAPR